MNPLAISPYKRINPEDYKGNAFFRCYIKDGKEYPRFLLSIHELDGVLIATDKKENEDSWWMRNALPIELIPELKEMLDEWLKSKLT